VSSRSWGEDQGAGGVVRTGGLGGADELVGLDWAATISSFKGHDGAAGRTQKHRATRPLSAVLRQLEARSPWQERLHQTLPGTGPRKQGKPGANAAVFQHAMAPRHRAESGRVRQRSRVHKPEPRDHHPGMAKHPGPETWTESWRRPAAVGGSTTPPLTRHHRRPPRSRWSSPTAFTAI